jgi:hypothetical protein
MKKLFFLALLLVAPGLNLQAGIEGDYVVTGIDTNNSPYGATASIVRDGENYAVTWFFESSTDNGVGIVKDDHLSICYQGNVDLTDVGVEVCKIKHDELRGTWAPLFSDDRGFETLQKVPN